MKTTTVGTCIVCTREIAVRSNNVGIILLVHHGYQRPGDGAIHGDCFAVKLPPHEVSVETAHIYRVWCEAQLVKLRNALVQHESNGVDVYSRLERVPVPTTAERPYAHLYGTDRDPGWMETFVFYRRDEREPARQRVFADLQADAIVRTRQRIDHNEKEVERMNVAISTWIRKPLGERVEVPPQRRRRRVWVKGS